MKLSNGIIRPGQIKSVLDNKGTIRAIVPGLFSAEDSIDVLPEIYPWSIGNANAFSMPHENDYIWVISFVDNPAELFYIRKDNLNSNLNNILSQDYEEVEVVCNKASGSGYAQLYFTDGTGWILQNDTSIIQIDKDGNILLSKDSSHCKISIDDNGISLGTAGGAAEPAVLGDKLVDCLENLSNVLMSISNAASTVPYTMPIKTAMEAPLQKYNTSIKKITSKYVTLD
jgi:hypothetical protein